MPSSTARAQRERMHADSAVPVTRARVFSAAAAGLLLFLLTWATYSPVGSFDFVNYDDPDYVSANPRVQAGLTWEGLRWAFTAVHSSNWHPVTWLSHMLDCHLFGLRPGAHHRVNVGLHGLAAVLLFGWLAWVTGRWTWAWVVAALFAWHPLRVESVAWIAERKDVLSMGFGLGSVWAYSAYARARGIPLAAPARARRWYALSWLLLALGLMSKPMLVTVPCLFLLLDYWPLRRMPVSPPAIEPSGAAFSCAPESWRRLMLEKVPFFALSAAGSLVTLIAQTRGGATVPLEALPVEARVAHAFAAYAAYLQKTFWPSNLAPFYPYELRDWADASVWVGVGVVAAVTAAAWFQRRRWPWGLVGWLWFLGTLVPVLGLVQVGRQSIADRYTYLPHVGLFWAIVWSLGHLWPTNRLWRGVRVALAAAVLTTSLGLTREQLWAWRNTRTLAEHTLRVNPDNFVAQTQLATELLREGQLEAAREACERALAIRPDYPEALNTLANVHLRQGRLDAARQAFELALRSDPTYPDAWHGLAAVHLERGEWAAAETAAARAVELWPLHLGARFVLARAQHQAGKLDEAIRNYRELLRLKPDLSSALQGLGGALALRGDLEAACQTYEQALALSRDALEIHLRLGILRLRQGQLEPATRHLEQVLTAQPDHGLAHAHMGHLCVARGDRAGARDHYRKALATHPDDVEVLNNLAWMLATDPDASHRDGALAVQLAERACRLTDHQVPLLLGTLAAAYAEAGRFAEAVATAEKAIARAAELGQTNLVERNRQLLELYRARQPVRE